MNLDEDYLRDLAALYDNEPSDPYGVADTLRAAADERDRLRKVIENAPHDYDCRTYDLKPSACTCWKADAL